MQPSNLCKWEVAASTHGNRMQRPGGATDRPDGRKKRTLAAGQAQLAAPEVEFVDLRRNQDELSVGLDRNATLSAGYAADEIGLALCASTTIVQRHVSRTRRIRTRLPQMWPLWAAGQIDEFKVATIDHAAARLTQGESWVKLDDALAPIAATKTTQQLRTWLNRFIAHRARRVHRRHQHTMARRDVSIEQVRTAPGGSPTKATAPTRPRSAP